MFDGLIQSLKKALMNRFDDPKWIHSRVDVHPLSSRALWTTGKQQVTRLNAAVSSHSKPIWRLDNPGFENNPLSLRLGDLEI